MEQQAVIDLIHKHTFMTLGCTDPVAIGLAVAHACQFAKGSIKEIRMRLDKNIYKDAVSVAIPGTRAIGIDLAVALAVIKGCPAAGLELFKDVQPTDIDLAKTFLDTHEVRFELNEEAEGIFIAATVTTDEGIYEALISGTHDRLVEKKINGKTIFRSEPPEVNISFSSTPDEFTRLKTLSIEEIVQAVENMPSGKIFFLQEGVKQNIKAANVGLVEPAGMELGKSLKNMVENTTIPDSPVNRIRILVAAAADARMGGVKIPVFGCFGSGNHGITFFITVGEMGRQLHKSDEDISRALTLGLLVVGAIKARTGILTPHCGCAVAAGTGACAAITYLLGGDCKQIETSVHLMTANLTGMLCDGAKYGCALKMATAAGVAIETAYLAIGGTRIARGDGIVGGSFQATMDNLEKVTYEGMKSVDQSILNILLAGQNRKGGEK